MGCDIHTFAEIKKDNKWIRVEESVFTDFHYNKKTEYPFDWRSYGMFAFLANVRNSSNVTPISKRKGLPDDSEYLNEINYDGITNKEYSLNEGDWHSHSYLTLKELLEFDYEQTFLNMGYSDEGELVTYKEFLNNGFFIHIEELKTLGEPEDVRVIFWFDN